MDTKLALAGLLGAALCLAAERVAMPAVQAQTAQSQWTASCEEIARHAMLAAYAAYAEAKATRTIAAKTRNDTVTLVALSVADHANRWDIYEAWKAQDLWADRGPDEWVMKTLEVEAEKDIARWYDDLKR